MTSWLLAACLINPSLRDERHRELDACEGPELCNGVDDNCDDRVDDEDPLLDPESAPVWYADGDADGFGRADVSVRQCEWPVGYVEDATDCDDTDPESFPGQEREDLPYDGYDLDCDHRNDFDADGDCFMPPGMETAYLAYIRRLYGDEPPPFCVDPEQTFADCLDSPHPSLEVPPEQVHPSSAAHPAPEVPHDGLDSDCAADNDFDADGDAFMPGELPLAQELLDAYIAAWGYEDRVSSWAALNPQSGLVAPAAGDCDDEDGERWPGAIERLGNGVDEDCGGDGDVSALAFWDGLLTGLSAPEINLLGERWIVAAGTDHNGLALPFPADARGGAPHEEPVIWHPSGTSFVLQPLLDAALETNPADTDADGLPDPVLWLASVRDSTNIDYSYLAAHALVWQTSTGVVRTGVSNAAFVPAHYDALSLQVAPDGDGAVYALACASDRLHAIHGALSQSLERDADDGCFFTASPTGYGVEFSLCGADSCSEWLLDEEAAFEELGVEANAWLRGDLDEDWLALVELDERAWAQPIGGAPELLPFDGRALSLDVAYDGGILYAAAVLASEGVRSLWLAHGPPGALTAAELPLPEGYEPDAVALAVAADRVAVAVSAQLEGGGQALGWVFLGP